MCDEAAVAGAAGFTAYIIEHNDWDGIDGQAAWVAVRQRFDRVLAVARGS